MASACPMAFCGSGRLLLSSLPSLASANLESERRNHDPWTLTATRGRRAEWTNPGGLLLHAGGTLLSAGGVGWAVGCSPCGERATAAQPGCSFACSRGNQQDPIGGFASSTGKRGGGGGGGIFPSHLLGRESFLGTSSPLVAVSLAVQGGKHRVVHPVLTTFLGGHFLTSKRKVGEFGAAPNWQRLWQSVPASGRREAGSNGGTSCWTRAGCYPCPKRLLRRAP